jgi:hypothetical protein
MQILKLQQWLDRDFTDNILKQLKNCLGKKAGAVC